MLVVVEHLFHLFCRPAQSLFFAQIGVRQRLGKEPGAAAQDQVWLLRQVDCTARRSEVPAIRLLVISIKLLNGLQKGLFGNAPFSTD